MVCTCRIHKFSLLLFATYVRGLTATSDTLAAEDICTTGTCQGDTAALLQGHAAVTKLMPPAPFASVPLNFFVITKQDGTGNVSKARLERQIADVRKYYNGDDPNALSMADIIALNASESNVSSCGQKCDVYHCYENGKYKPNLDISGCWCEDQYCEKWSSLGKMHGARADAAIDFTLQAVTYVTNDVWHDQCCCAHASGLGYEPKQTEILDQLVDKEKVRDQINVIICDMKSTAGQATINGGRGCAGGPNVMLTHGFESRTLAHELGHFFGLYHTWNEECPSNGIMMSCNETERCDDAINVGDRISDTPIHKKQGMCSGRWNVDSCPGGGPDPLDNLMSYSNCQLQRFTEGQVVKMKQTITDYFPAFMTILRAGQPKDFPCDPEFPSKIIPSGYAPPPQPTPAPVPPAQPSSPPSSPPSPPPSPGCNLEAGQCDTFDKKGCNCHDSSICCKDHGCGGSPGFRECLPCQWKAWGVEFTSDSCR